MVFLSCIHGGGKRVLCSLDALSATIDFTRSQDWNHKFVVLGGAETWCFVQLKEAQK